LYLLCPSADCLLPQATEAEVRKLLAPSGVFAWQVQLPTRADGRSTGFAFASFMSYHEAEKALLAANGQLVRKRPVAVDWALGKGQYQQLQQQQQQGAAAANGEAAQGSLQDSDGDSGSKGEFDLEASEGDEMADDDDEDGEGGSSEGDEEDEEGLLSDEEEASEEEEGSEEEGGSADEGFDQDRAVMQSALDAIIAQEQPQQQAPEQQQKPAKQQQAGSQDAAATAAFRSAAVACTVFVRGLPLDVTSQEMQVGRRLIFRGLRVAAS
jgi:nucleolar protein 4